MMIELETRNAGGEPGQSTQKGIEIWIRGIWRD